MGRSSSVLCRTNRVVSCLLNITAAQPFAVLTHVFFPPLFRRVDRSIQIPCGAHQIIVVNAGGCYRREGRSSVIVGGLETRFMDLQTKCFFLPGKTKLGRLVSTEGFPYVLLPIGEKGQS